MDMFLGQHLGHYRLICLLGQGGFARVYLGEHVHLGTQAAIKVLQTVLCRDEVARFEAEARTIAHLVHPHIIRVLDFGMEGPTPYLVMEYAKGGTLRTKHPKGSRLPLDTVNTYLSQIAGALQAAHEQKIIHRDIKPENMLLNEHKGIMLSDFGIAVIGLSSRQQSTQDVVGTAAYMAPEQIQGKPHYASDQYALGIVVYEWLCGIRPFSGTFVELCTQHLFAPPPSLRKLVPALPAAVEQAVLTALAKDPKSRFGSVAEFAHAFERASLHVSSSLTLRTSQPAKVVPSTSEQPGVGEQRPASSHVLAPAPAKDISFSSVQASLRWSEDVISPMQQQQHISSEKRVSRQGSSPLQWSKRNVPIFQQTAQAKARYAPLCWPETELPPPTRGTGGAWRWLQRSILWGSVMTLGILLSVMSLTQVFPGSEKADHGVVGIIIVLLSCLFYVVRNRKVLIVGGLCGGLVLIVVGMTFLFNRSGLPGVLPLQLLGWVAILFGLVFLGAVFGSWPEY